MLFITVTDKWCMILGGVFKTAGLGIADDYVAARLHQHAEAATVVGLVHEPEGLFAVDGDGGTAALGGPPVVTAAGRMDAAVAFAHGRHAVDDDIFGALSSRPYDRMRT